MPEQSLCILGKKPKKLSYIDKENNKYVQIVFKLKEEITANNLNEYFNRLYYAKLDSGYETSFTDNYTTKDFIACLKEILIKEGPINLKVLGRMIADTQPMLLPVDTALYMFSEMFELITHQEYPLEEYNPIANQTCIVQSKLTETIGTYDENAIHNTKMVKRLQLKKINRHSSRTRMLAS